ncbi:MAG: aldo/keto reductase family protein [Armatimonadetes bacterium]|nr:aldo/keto reductase family protein [Armatimonadota bacterium]
MRYRRLGKSGVKVSEIALGGWLTQGRTITDDMTNSIVHRAFDLGVNFFDTADVYNMGEAEISLAKAIKDLRRDHLFLATKCYWPMSDHVNDRGLSRKHIVESVNHSLRRLRTDYVDLFQFHRFDPDVPMEEMVRAIDDLIRQGKVLYWGVSCWSAGQIMDAWHTAGDYLASKPVSNQPPYNMFQRDIERDVISTCDQLGMGQVVFSPLAQGVLTGKYKPGGSMPEGSRGADEKSNQFMQKDLEEAKLRQVEEMGKIADRLGISMAQLALRWCLRQDNLSSVIVGATKVSQIEETVKAGEIDVPCEVWDEIEKILNPEA